MSRPVGVLAKLDAFIAMEREAWGVPSGEIVEARAAVAELIDKARAVTATGDERTLRMAIDELRPALARAQGGRP